MAEIASGIDKIIIDFSKIDYISSSGPRIILKTAKVLKPKNGIVAICNTNEQIHEVLETSGFLDILNTFNPLGDAVSFVNY